MLQIAVYFVIPYLLILDVLDISCCSKCAALYFAGYFAVPVVELVDVLDVSEHDVVLVGEAGRDVFGAARHLPQVRLNQGNSFTISKL